MKVFNKTRNTFIVEHLTIADSFFSRLTGLLNRASLAPGEGLLITRCQSIHMFFMRFAIDAIFVDKAHRVVGIVKDIKPYQLSPIFFKSCFVIEVPVGTINASQTFPGDQLEIPGYPA